MTLLDLAKALIEYRAAAQSDDDGGEQHPGARVWGDIMADRLEVYLGAQGWSIDGRTVHTLVGGPVEVPPQPAWPR